MATTKPTSYQVVLSDVNDDIAKVNLYLASARNPQACLSLKLLLQILVSWQEVLER